MNLMMVPRRDNRDSAVVLACPFAVLVVGAALTHILSTSIAGAMGHQLWDFGPFMVLSSWVTYGIAASCFLAIDALRLRSLPERCWRTRRHMLVGTLVSAGLGVVSGLGVAVFFGAGLFALGVEHLVPEGALTTLGVFLCGLMLVVAVANVRTRWSARVGCRPARPAYLPPEGR
jgi:hypothetical protein